MLKYLKTFLMRLIGMIINTITIMIAIMMTMTAISTSIPRIAITILSIIITKILTLNLVMQNRSMRNLSETTKWSLSKDAEILRL